MDKVTLQIIHNLGSSEFRERIHSFSILLSKDIDVIDDLLSSCGRTGPGVARMAHRIIAFHGKSGILKLGQLINTRIGKPIINGDDVLYLSFALNEVRKQRSLASLILDSLESSYYCVDKLKIFAAEDYAKLFTEDITEDLLITMIKEAFYLSFYYAKTQHNDISSSLIRELVYIFDNNIIMNSSNNNMKRLIVYKILALGVLTQQGNSEIRELLTNINNRTNIEIIQHATAIALYLNLQNDSEKMMHIIGYATSKLEDNIPPEDTLNVKELSIEAMCLFDNRSISNYCIKILSSNNDYYKARLLNYLSYCPLHEWLIEILEFCLRLQNEYLQTVAVKILGDKFRNEAFNLQRMLNAILEAKSTFNYRRNISLAEETIYLLQNRNIIQ